MRTSSVAWSRPVRARVPDNRGLKRNATTATTAVQGACWWCTLAKKSCEQQAQNTVKTFAMNPRINRGLHFSWRAPVCWPPKSGKAQGLAFHRVSSTHSTLAILVSESVKSGPWLISFNKPSDSRSVSSLKPYDSSSQWWTISLHYFVTYSP